MRRRVIAVIGASQPSDEELRLAERVGEHLGEAGVVLVTGGLGGVMEAASRGCQSKGGLVVGMLPGPKAESANAWVELAVPTGLGDARNALIANMAEVFVAVGGGFGTLSEIAYALQRGKKVVALSTWQLDGERARGANLEAVTSAREAARVALEAVGVP